MERRQAPAAVFVADARRQKYEPGFYKVGAETAPEHARWYVWHI